MKAIVRQVNPAELERRRKLGLDRWDEVWEGVLHLAPAPTPEHQRIVKQLVLFLSPVLQKWKRGTLHVAVNVFRERGPVEDYRIPDLVFLSNEREDLIAKDGVRGGGPDAVIEVRSPDDETYESSRSSPIWASVRSSSSIGTRRRSKCCV
jgi:Uma2 family endonuclease